MNANDSQIASLKAQVEAKRQQLGNRPVFHPRTNCQLTFPISKEVVNLHTLTSEGAKTLLVSLHTQKKAADELGFSPYVLSGYTIQEWIDDARSRLALVEWSERQSQLNALERKLEGLLSEDAKTANELASIADLLK